MTPIATAFLWAYRYLLSPLLHQAVFWKSGCRFTPTCSAYGLAAVRQYGLPIGFMFILKRLTRCHPFSAGGYDPVPERLTHGAQCPGQPQPAIMPSRTAS